MKEVYELRHSYIVEIDDGEEVHETKLLGFFSSENKSREAIEYYLKQEGFKNFPNDFILCKVEADVDDYNEISGEFENKVYYLSHEWYDGEYDYVTYIGYYSTRQKAEMARIEFESDEAFLKHQDGFVIDEYLIDEMEWKEGFCSWDDMESAEEI